MFRRLLQNISITKNVGIQLSILRTSTTAPLQIDEGEEYNYVKLLGTIISGVRTLPNGVRSLIVRTVEGSDIYCNHHVNIKSDEPKCMSAGERIYIFGNISSKPFSLEDGRLRQSLTIKSKYARLRINDRNVPNIKDINNVQIVAKIVSEIRHTNKYALFTLASTHIPKGDGHVPGTITTEYHKVIIYDQSVLEVVRNDIRQFDRISVEGKVGYMPFKNAKGKQQHGGFIVGHSIQRIS